MLIKQLVCVEQKFTLSTTQSLGFVSVMLSTTGSLTLLGKGVIVNCSFCSFGYELLNDGLTGFPICGDGYVFFPETCDDGGQGGCNPNCIETVNSNVQCSQGTTLKATVC